MTVEEGVTMAEAVASEPDVHTPAPVPTANIWAARAAAKAEAAAKEDQEQKQRETKPKAAVKPVQRKQAQQPVIASSAGAHRGHVTSLWKRAEGNSVKMAPQFPHSVTVLNSTSELPGAREAMTGDYVTEKVGVRQVWFQLLTRSKHENL